jgi:hypothetical protein
MPYADIDEVLEQRTPLIYATDQRTFTTQGGVNTFGVLVPLMTADGKRFEDPDAVFSNRGRVWWMLRPEHKSFPSDAGSIWSGPIENAVKFDAEKRDKDRYQVDRDRIEHGAGDWVDLLDVPFDPADLDAALSEDGIRVARPPLSLVILRGETHVVGPFRAAWDTARNKLSLTAVNAGKPLVWRAPREVLRHHDDVEEFTFRANNWDPDANKRELTIRLVRRVALERLQAEGQPIDAASENTVIKWALQQAGYTNRERSEFRAALDRIAEAGETGADHPVRLARFRALCERADLILAAGRDAAELVAKQPAFAELVRRHADELAASRVAELVKQRSGEVEKAVREMTERRDGLKKEMQKLEAQYDTRKAEQDARLRSEHAEALRSIERREKELAEGFANLQKEQQSIEGRLREVVELYESRGRELGNQLVAQFPVLQRFLGTSTAKSAAEAVSARSPLPTWLDQARSRGGLSEEAFLAQFRDVAARRGYVFAETDLVNFHVAVKVGFWTVLAGPSGTGKTSLPRLYAEALGAGDEYLGVPVKPDWLDDRDVVGAFNSLTGRFEPGSSGLVDHLIAASEDRVRGRGGIYLVALDEMNLARVEHYFAQFLSVADKPEGQRRITLFARGVERVGEPYAPYRELPLGENVRVIGTVNIDETTHFFSPKVLDRAAVLVLEPPEISRAPAPRARAERLDVPSVHFDEWRSWIHGPEEAAPEVRQLLLDLDRHLRLVRSGLAFRLRDRVLAYTASARGLLSQDRAVDFALAQSVLPRIRTQSPRFVEVADELLRLLPEARFPRTAAYLTALREAGGAHDFFQLL